MNNEPLGMPIYAVVGVITNANGRVLALGRKHDHDELGLPGGKLEPGETPEQALTRELSEEVGVRVITYKQIYEGLDQHGGKRCLSFMITSWEGEPRSLEGPPLAWVSPLELISKSGDFSGYIATIMTIIMADHIIMLRSEVNGLNDEVVRLCSIVRELEKSKGVTAVRLERSDAGKLAGIVTAPSLDEPKAAAYLAMLLGHSLLVGAYDGALATIGEETADGFMSILTKSHTGGR